MKAREASGTGRREGNSRGTLILAMSNTQRKASTDHAIVAGFIPRQENIQHHCGEQRGRLALFDSGHWRRNRTNFLHLLRCLIGTTRPRMSEALRGDIASFVPHMGCSAPGCTMECATTAVTQKPVYIFVHIPHGPLTRPPCTALTLIHVLQWAMQQYVIRAKETYLCTADEGCSLALRDLRPYVV